MVDHVKRSVHQDGDLTALDLRTLLIGVPDEAVISITISDTGDYRNSREPHWWFEASWI